MVKHDESCHTPYILCLCLDCELQHLREQGILTPELRVLMYFVSLPRNQDKCFNHVLGGGVFVCFLKFSQSV